MELVTIKQFAEDQKITYEAVRRQVVRYAAELEGHIVTKNRTQYLDEEAVKFLKERRRESPIILMNMDQGEEIGELKDQIETLKASLMQAQNELLKEKDRVIRLQDELRNSIEESVKYNTLLESSKRTEEKLQETKDQISELEKDLNDQKKQIEDLTRERDAAQTEAQSFRKSIFGFYRKD